MIIIFNFYRNGLVIIDVSVLNRHFDCIYVKIATHIKRT